MPYLAAGTLVAEHFEVEALLGHGGMGAVYRAKDRQLGRRVAIKLGLRGTDVARIQREASVLASLAHPNVVTIYEIGEHDGAPFVAMELCNGGTLRAWLETPRPWRTIVERFRSVGDGLAAAHAAGIVHGDIKPDNILLGDDGRPRLADFGLARATHTDNDGDGERLKAAGTPRYMAPELAHGPPTARSDQFAFAVAMFEALAGTEPFSRDADERRKQIESGPSTQLPVPRRISAAIARALRADPEARWPDVATLIAQLQPPRRRWLVPALATAVLGTAVVIAFAPWRTSGADNEDLTSIQPARCDGLPVDIDGEWTPATRAEVIAAHPRGSGAVALFADELGYFVREWREARLRLCKTLPTEPSWSLAIGDAGRACLLARRDDLRLLRSLRDLDSAELVGHVVALDAPSSCADVNRLESHARTASIEPVEREYRAIAMLRDRGHGAEALGRAKALVASLPRDAPPLALAMANSLLGELLLAQVGLAESAAPTRTAFFAYRVAGSPQAFDPALRLVDAYSQAGELALAEEWLAHARAEAQRVTVSPSNRAILELIAARLLSLRGDHDGAFTAAEAAARSLDDSEDPRTVLTVHSIRSSQSIFLAEARRLEESLAIARELVAALEKLYGPAHPLLINDLFNVGLGELDLGRPADALVTLRRAREIADASLPPNAVLRGYALWNEALALGRNDPRGARTLFDHAIAVVEAAQGASADVAQLRADREKWSRP